MLKPCLDCGALTPNPRCPTDTRVQAQAKRQRRPRASHAETQRRAGVVAEWVQTYGYVCPGWQRPAHRSTDLTADHVLAFAVTGSEDGALTVLCRACNGAKQAR